MKNLFYLLILCSLLYSCDQDQSGIPKSASGVSKANVKVQVDENGNSVEQNNIIERLRRDNLPGSIKHLYVISAYSGQVIIYSTVKGKVTSSSKRLTPGNVSNELGFRVDIDNESFHTKEVLGDDGSYGSSDPYIYWFDVKGVYHQHYLSGGQIVHISDQPIAVKSVIINMESEK
jgi:hypothetical protein